MGCGPVDWCGEEVEGLSWGGGAEVGTEDEGSWPGGLLGSELCRVASGMEGLVFWNGLGALGR